MKEKNEETRFSRTDLEKLDGVDAAPGHHRVIYEDERVRVTELKVAPGDRVPVHTHRWPSVNYVVAPSDFLSYDAEGRVKLDTRAAAGAFGSGHVFCLPAFPPPHAVENVGEQMLHGVSVELKDPAPDGES
jgi:quercetin dioxygenase-like cupin family protein